MKKVLDMVLQPCKMNTSTTRQEPEMYTREQMEADVAYRLAKANKDMDSMTFILRAFGFPCTIGAVLLEFERV